MQHFRMPYSKIFVFGKKSHFKLVLLQWIVQSSSNNRNVATAMCRAGHFHLHYDKVYLAFGLGIKSIGYLNFKQCPSVKKYKTQFIGYYIHHRL